MIAEMDELSKNKRLEIESLISELRIPPIDAYVEVLNDFSIDLEVLDEKKHLRNSNSKKN